MYYCQSLTQRVENTPVFIPATTTVTHLGTVLVSLKSEK